MRLELDVVILSNDKDMLRLVREPNLTISGDHATFRGALDDPVSTCRVSAVDPKSSITYDAQTVRHRFGVWPHALPDMLALAGDSSDGYPGVRGIGPKMAARLINEHGDVEQIIERVNVLPRKVHEKIVTQLDELRIFRRLAGLVDDLPLPVGLAELTRPRAAR